MNLWASRLGLMLGTIFMTLLTVAAAPAVGIAAAVGFVIAMAVANYDMLRENWGGFPCQKGQCGQCVGGETPCRETPRQPSPN